MRACCWMVTNVSEAEALEMLEFFFEFLVFSKIFLQSLGDNPNHQKNQISFS